MRERIAKFMYGRNGNDQLNILILGFSCVLLIADIFVGGRAVKFLTIAAIAFLGLAYFRMLSKNLYRRREENSKYLRLKKGAINALKLRKERWLQRREYKFFTCPSCRAVLRVPRGRGKVRVVCSRCGKAFLAKT